VCSVLAGAKNPVNLGGGEIVALRATRSITGIVLAWL
jgi:hypothetical protein